jgi:hypothetical protein
MILIIIYTCLAITLNILSHIFIYNIVNMFGLKQLLILLSQIIFESLYAMKHYELLNHLV